MKCDDASWHSGGDFPKNSPQEYGGTHIALFLKWCFIKGWAGEIHLEEWPEDVAKVIDGTMTGTRFLFMACDGKLTDVDLNDEGNAFAAVYLGDDGCYLSDYVEYFGDLMYEAPESDHDFNQFAAIMEARFRSGILTSEGWADYASDRALSRYSRWLREAQGLSVLPASTAGLHALLSKHAREPLPADRYVAILTGRKV